MFERAGPPSHRWCVIAAGIVVLTATITDGKAQPTAPHLDARTATAVDGPMTMETFLDRLMLAESGGRDNVANPRSTAVGPFQFVVATFLSLAQRHFTAETAGMTLPQVLALRTNRDFARRMADAYTRENAARLTASGHAATWPHLRLAFFAGVDGAIRILNAKPQTPVAILLGAAVVAANPFLVRMTALDLVERSARDLLQPASTSAGIAIAPVQKRKAFEIPVHCDLGLPSCRRWLALAERRQLRKFAGTGKAQRGL